MKDKKKIDMNINLRLKIIEHYGTQERFASASGIQEAIISKLIRKIRTPTFHQDKIISDLLKTPSNKLFGNSISE